MLAQRAQGPGFDRPYLRSQGRHTHLCAEGQKFKVMLSELEADLGHVKRLCLKIICLVSTLGWVNVRRRAAPTPVSSGDVCCRWKPGSDTLSTHNAELYPPVQSSLALVLHFGSV